MDTMHTKDRVFPSTRCANGAYISREKYDMGRISRQPNIRRVLPLGTDRRRPYHQAVHCSSHSFARRARQTRCHGSGIGPIFDLSGKPARRDHSLFADAHIRNSFVYEPLRLSKPDCPGRTRARPILELVRDLHLHPANGLRIAIAVKHCSDLSLNIMGAGSARSRDTS